MGMVRAGDFRVPAPTHSATRQANNGEGPDAVGKVEASRAPSNGAPAIKASA